MTLRITQLGTIPPVVFNRYRRTCGMNDVGARIGILVVHDHPMLGEGIDAIIASQSDMSRVAHAMNVTEALLAYRQHRPDVVLIEVGLPNGGGIEALKAIRKEFCQARAIMLGASDDAAQIQLALDAGARAYLLKGTTRGELLRGIRSVHGGQRYFEGAVASRLAENIGDANLTDREFQVLRLIRDGTGNKEIAELLSIAETTVNFHIKNIVKKLRANDRTHAVVIALRRGWLTMR